jgi:hypothetical protein
MLKLKAPVLGRLEQKIRSIGTSTFPLSNNFWFGDIPQIPGKLHHKFTVETDQLGVVHELRLNGSLALRFTPKQSPETIKLVLSNNVYDYVLTAGTVESKGSFQISLKELVWWTWEQQLIASFQDLELLESYFNNPANLMLFEISFPQELLQVSNTPYAIRAFANSTRTKSIQKNLLAFAGGLFDIPVTPLKVASDLTPVDFSKITIPFLSSSLSRRGAFCSRFSDRIVDTSWDHVNIADSEERSSYEPVSCEFSYFLRVKSHQVEPLQRSEISFSLWDSELKHKILDLDYARNSAAHTFDFTCISPVQDVTLVANYPIDYQPIAPKRLTLIPGYEYVEDIYWKELRTYVQINAPTFLTWTLEQFDLDYNQIMHYTGKGSKEFDLDHSVAGWLRFTAIPIPGYIFPEPFEQPTRLIDLNLFNINYSVPN